LSLELLISDEEFKKLEFIESEKVVPLKKEGILGVFVKDQTGEVMDYFLSLQEEQEYPWKYYLQLIAGKNLFDLKVAITVTKPELSLRALRTVFPVGYWTFAKELLKVFFFAEVEKNGKKDYLFHSQTLLLKLPEPLVDYADEEIKRFGIELFFDKVLQVHNPYSPEYAYGVWQTFVKNRYRKSGR